MRIDRADSEAELLGPPISNREIVKVVAGDFEVRLAKTAEEIDAAQALRYRIFYEEMAARPSPEVARLPTLALARQVPQGQRAVA